MRGESCIRSPKIWMDKQHVYTPNIDTQRSNNPYYVGILVATISVTPDLEQSEGLVEATS